MSGLGENNDNQHFRHSEKSAFEVLSLSINRRLHFSAI